jgi:mono/diheme cytochrome c family protein
MRPAVLLVALTCGLAAQDAADFFQQNCASCHTIGGGRLTGPDLKGVLERKDRAWLSQFIVQPKSFIDRGDAYALRLLEEARGVVMPNIAGMAPARAEALLDLIAAESKLAKSRFIGAQISDRPFTPQDYVRGTGLFTGTERLSRGGTACVSCHAIAGAGGLGGGRFGPDLTKVYERLGGRKGLGGWLVAPPSPTMQAVFRKAPLQPEEILPLLALFEDSAKNGVQRPAVGLFMFLLLGLGGAVTALISLDAIWRRRFRAVRRPMVEMSGK